MLNSYFMNLAETLRLQTKDSPVKAEKSPLPQSNVVALQSWRYQHTRNDPLLARAALQENGSGSCFSCAAILPAGHGILSSAACYSCCRVIRLYCA